MFKNFFIKKIFNEVKKQGLILSFILFFLILICFDKQNAEVYVSYIDFKTIYVIFYLMVLTLSMDLSGIFSAFAYKLTVKSHTEKKLAFVLVFISVFLSPILTNDITLFIVIPLTISLEKYIKNDLRKLVFLEAISVNVGSSLTPVGNPQNIFIWHKWDIPFFHFIYKMLPVFAVQFFLILSFTFFLFPNKKLVLNTNKSDMKKDKKLFLVSFALFVYFIFVLEADLTIWFSIIPLILFLFFYPQIIKKVDWGLLILFVLMFLDFGVLSNLKTLNNLIINKIQLNTPKQIFLFSAFLSQFISNFPATIFVSKFSDDWISIAYGVNIGGNGLFIGSLANIIALRITAKKDSIFKFHFYSIPFFILSLVVFVMFFF